MDYRQARKIILRGKIKPLYLFSGPGDYLKEELLRDILQIMKEKKGELFLERREGSELDLAELLLSTRQKTIFSQGRLIWVSNPPYLAPAGKRGTTPGGKSPERDKAEEIISLLLQEDRALELIIIFSLPEVDRQKKIVKIIEKAGVLVEFPLLRGSALLEWIGDELRKEGKRAETATLQELVERVGEDLFQLKKELEKIVAYLGADEVLTAQVVQKLVAAGRQGSIFRLVSAVAEKRLEEALFHLSRLRQQNEPPLVIIAMVARHYRLLYQAFLFKKRGMGAGQVAASLKVPLFAAEELLRQAENYREKTLLKVLLYLKEIDYGIKKGRIDAAGALDNLVLALTVGHLPGRPG